MICLSGAADNMIESSYNMSTSCFGGSSRTQLRSFLLFLLEGVLIGIGAILPGISGGVLMVIFGLYEPMMQTLANPMRGVRRYWKIFLPAVAGWAIGFFLLAGVVSVLLEKEAAVVTSLFVGMILGTFPSLFRGGRELHPQKKEWTALIVSAAVLLVFFFTIKYFFIENPVIPSFGWFIVCGILWGVSLVAPGMTSSSVLLLLGLLQPLSEGLSSFDFAIIAPFLLGIVSALLLLSRLINYLLSHHYSIFYYCIIGFVIASTLPIIPWKFSGVLEGVFALAALVIGIGLSLLMDRISVPVQQKETK